MEEELTTKMHSEFEVDEETELLHRCITIWCYTGCKSENDVDSLSICKQYGVPPEVAIANKEYCLSLKSNE